MTRAEMLAATDGLLSGYVDTLRELPLSYWRSELPPGAVGTVAARARRLADELALLAKAEQNAVALIEGRA